MRPSKIGNKRLRVVIFIGFLFFSCRVAHAQSGEIRGSVTDTTGAAVPGASVVARFTDTNALHQTTTDDTGQFVFADLAVGVYAVDINAEGFAVSNTPDVNVEIGHVTRLDRMLRLGKRADTVIVSAYAATVETQSTQLGAVMAQTAIRELPLSTRDAYQLLQLRPACSRNSAPIFSTVAPIRASFP